jgi:uncharacterized repeat protein (TIGR01451 family)
MRSVRSRYLPLAALFLLLAALTPAPLGVAVSAESQEAGPTTDLSNGITFDHANWNDPIRMVGEPGIWVDSAGGMYTHGPGGSTTQSSWFWKSSDKGIQWHLVGCPLKSNCQNGGGDTDVVTGGNNDVFATDLQTLACNSTFRSLDAGATWTSGEGCFPGNDRQWLGIYDPNNGPTGRRIYLMANELVLGCYVFVSTDNGLTYLPTGSTGTIGGSCIGKMAVNPDNGHIYIPGSANTKVSVNGGATWINRPRPPGVQGNFFANMALDTAGNLWQGWTTSCTNPATTPCKAFVAYSTDEGQTWTTHQVNTGPGSPVGTSPDLRQVLFPWTVAGDPGRVAIVYYGTNDTQRAGGFPGGINALWHTYASISTNAMDENPTWTQVQADEHVFHRGTICTGGFPGCLTANADRSLADFFAVDKDPEGRLYIAYNENSDLSLVVPDPPQYIGKPIDAVIRLRTGPSLFEAQGDLLSDPSPANVTIDGASRALGTLFVNGTQGLPPGNWATDPAGDASFPVVPVQSPSHSALDIREVSASDDGTNLTFKLRMTDLSPTALAEALTAGGTPSWMVTWWQGKGGIGPAGMTSGPFHSHWFVKWLGGTNFVFGKVSSIDLPALGAPTPKLLTYVPTGTATGSVNGNEVTISAPLASLGGLSTGDKIDHVSAFANVEHADVTTNDWADQAKSFSYVIGTPAAQQHLSDGYVEVSLDPDFATSTLAMLNPANNTWTAQIPDAPASGTVYARQVLAKDLYTPVWDDVQAGPVAQLGYGAIADVAITKTDNTTAAAPTGRNLTYTITVTNNGPDPAEGAFVDDFLPSSVTFVSATPSMGSCSGTGPVSCVLGTLANGETATVDIVVRPTEAGTITNRASGSSDLQDPDFSNNMAEETTTICRITSRRTSIPCG